MKKIIFVIIVLMLISGGYFYSKQSSLTDNTKTVATNSSPARPAEINGVITELLGNEIKIAKEIDKVVLSEAEQEAKKAEMQKMTPEERSALRAEEQANTKTVETKIIIPVGVPIVKGSGNANGEVIKADIIDLKEGSYVSIWTDKEGNIEYIKIKGV